MSVMQRVSRQRDSIFVLADMSDEYHEDDRDWRSDPASQSGVYTRDVRVHPSFSRAEREGWEVDPEYPDTMDRVSQGRRESIWHDDFPEGDERGGIWNHAIEGEGKAAWRTYPTLGHALDGSRSVEFGKYKHVKNPIGWRHE